jgi:hypothetical protein
MMRQWSCQYVIAGYGISAAVALFAECASIGRLYRGQPSGTSGSVH